MNSKVQMRSRERSASSPSTPGVDLSLPRFSATGIKNSQPVFIAKRGKKSITAEMFIFQDGGGRGKV